MATLGLLRTRLSLRAQFGFLSGHFGHSDGWQGGPRLSIRPFDLPYVFFRSGCSGIGASLNTPVSLSIALEPRN